MTRQDGITTLRFIDRGDWLQAIVFLVFLIMFPMAIFSMWQEPREFAPLHFLIPFAAVFAAATPFMIKAVLKASTREILVDRNAGTIRLIATRPFRRTDESIPLDEVAGLMFETTDNDGYWHTAKLKLANDRTIQFAQGSHEPAVRADCARMAAALPPGLPIEDRRG